MRITVSAPSTNLTNKCVAVCCSQMHLCCVCDLRRVFHAYSPEKKTYKHSAGVSEAVLLEPPI
jgi:hypothetical protein